MRRKGQHFLVDGAIIDCIVDGAKLSRKDVVLEIGPGTGNLTEALAARAGRVYAVEVDPELAGELEGRFSNVEVICKDVLRLDLPDYNKVVSNLPYQISSKITLRLLQRPFDLAVLMYQREFVKRLTALPGSRAYGRLSINAAYYSSVELLCSVPRTAFKPVPNVDSAVVRLRPNLDRPPVDQGAFEELTRTLFTMRRKKSGKALAALAPGAVELADPAVMEKRPEELTLDEVVGLANALSGALSRTHS
ncbi:MAG: ribosomal RNA small subunit methyltransferase A [Methanosarcinales archaeon]|nr:ribosomal RNA small subunit methyltransferase A [Methanosarcinales archaeon]